MITIAGAIVLAYLFLLVLPALIAGAFWIAVVGVPAVCALTLFGAMPNGAHAPFVLAALILSAVGWGFWRWEKADQAREFLAAETRIDPANGLEDDTPNEPKPSNSGKRDNQ